jgi:hypothetical protein
LFDIISVLIVTIDQYVRDFWKLLFYFANSSNFGTVLIRGTFKIIYRDRKKKGISVLSGEAVFLLTIGL